MENQNPTTTAKDFFLHLGAMVGLYASAVALINLLFSVINKAFLEVAQIYYYSLPNISFPVATLIIVFPIFILLSWLLEREYGKDLMKKEIWIRRWSIFVTLFVSGLILIGDLVVILYRFLDGQDLTTAFVLKALTVLLVTAMVFGYYVQDIRERVSNSMKKFWVIFISVIILIAIILGFSVIGSPQTQRLIRYDNQKIQDLQNIQWQIVNFYQRKSTLPVNLTEVNDPISSYMIPNDPQSGMFYEYQKTGNLSFELCAEFNKASQMEMVSNRLTPIESYSKLENWDHSAGKVCFERTIDPELYPVTKPVR